jgi:hypothetical protein
VIICDARTGATEPRGFEILLYELVLVALLPVQYVPTERVCTNSERPLRVVVILTVGIRTKLVRHSPNRMVPNTFRAKVASIDHPGIHHLFLHEGISYRSDKDSSS